MKRYRIRVPKFDPLSRSSAPTATATTHNWHDEDASDEHEGDEFEGDGQLTDAEVDDSVDSRNSIVSA
jgi:hypothetical protein